MWCEVVGCGVRWWGVGWGGVERYTVLLGVVWYGWGGVGWRGILFCLVCCGVVWVVWCGEVYCFVIPVVSKTPLREGHGPKAGRPHCSPLER